MGKRQTTTPNPLDKPSQAPETLSEPHYSGHRERLRERFLKSGENALADYELLELVLFRAIPRRDVKPLAKQLINTFGSFAQVIAAPPPLLAQVVGLGQGAITEFKIIQAAAHQLARGEITKRKELGNTKSVIDYCRMSMAFADKEMFRILFLDKKNGLIADEIQQTGTVDHTPVYTREVIKRALELSASALILVHNHPSGDPSPSLADIKMTQELIRATRPMNMTIIDHIIIGAHGHASFKALDILEA